MKKLLTILILLLATVSIHAEKVTTLWEGTYTDAIVLNSGTVATFKAGDKLRVYATVPAGGANFKIVYKREADGWTEKTIPSIEAQYPWMNGGEAYKDFILTAADITALSEHDIYISKGENSTITKVSLITEDSTPSYEGTELTPDDGSSVPTTFDGGWSSLIQFGPTKFTAAKTGDILIIYLSGIGENPAIMLQEYYGTYHSLQGSSLSITDNKAQYVLDASAAAFLKDNGMCIKGANLTVDKVTLKDGGGSAPVPELNVSGFYNIVYDVVSEVQKRGIRNYLGSSSETAASDNQELLVTFAEGASDAKVIVSYVDGTADAEATLESEATTVSVPLTSGKAIKKVEIRSTADDGTIKFTLSNIAIQDIASVTQYTLTVTQPDGGKIQIGGNDAVTQAYDEGTELSLAAVPISNYQFSEWSSTTEGVVTDGNKSTSPLAITMNQAINITASFSVIDAKILDNVHELVTNDEFGSMGSATTGNTVRVLISKGIGDKALEIYTKTSGWDYVLLSNTVPEGNYVDIAVTAENKDNISERGLYIKGSNITVTNAGILYSFSVTEPANGTVAIKVNDETTPTEETSFISGTKMTAKATATTTDYEFASWTKTEDAEWSSTDNPLVINSLDGNYTLTATFTNPKILDYTHDYFIAASNFSDIAVGGSITFTCTVPENQIGQLKIIYPDSEGNKVYTNDPVTLANDGTYMYSITDETICNSIKTHGLWIQGANATFVSVTFTASVTPVFDENGKADLSKFVASGNDQYNTTTHIQTVSAAWEGGIGLTIPASENISAKYLIVKFAEATAVKVMTGYSDNSTAPNVIMDSNATEMKVALDVTKVLTQVVIQGITDGQTVKLSEVSISNKCTLTVSAPATYGSVAVKQGQTPTTATEFDYNTSLTLTATPASSDYSFKQWVIGETTKTDNPYTFTITGDTEITAEFKETPLTAGDTRTLWVNADGTDVSWNEIGTQGATLGAILEVGEKILVTVKSASTTETDRQVCLRDANSEIVTGFSSFDEVTAYPYVAKFTLTSDYVDKLKNGFHISGTNTTVSKMELYKPLPDTRTEKNLYGEAAMDSTSSDGIAIAAEKFVNISEDDVLMIYLSGAKATDFITLREMTNWSQLTSSYKEYLSAGQTTFTLTLNDVNVAKLKAGGLNLTGGNFTISKMTIKTNGEIPADEGGEEGDDDDDEETIIDEETGETDLTELTAQDDTKTTLTQNEDGSITMTTTEAYCAAQIWFNDPEPVDGNVLKVELAESKVNVTVTVKYTDGTESQMSANTKAVVSARATTRAVASGTTIEVPLETGKEVQNIEVKNNEAGTITIKKMQVTTVNVFTGGVANLAMLKPQSNATYDTSAHTLATTKGWTGATVSPVAGENVSGKELLIEFADASKVKVSVKYRTDVEGPSKIMDKAAKSVRLALDNTKNIQEISIQPTEAAIITFTKIAVNSEESDDGSLKPGKTITLWESATGETLSWNEVAKQDASVGEMLKEYDELLITVSGVVKDCDWPKLFIRDASSEQAGNEVLLNDVGSFPYTVRIVLTGEMAQQLQKGFSICGDGVTVKKLQVYRPEAPKTGDIHLVDLNYGYNSSYDKGSHTITTTARWAARGWEIGDKRYNDKNLITVKFEAVDFPVTLKMEYTTGLQTAQATSVGVPAGRTELLLEIPKGISKLNRVYIIYENPGKVKLTEASVTYMENLKLSTAIQAFEADGVIRDGRYDTDGWYNLRGMRIPEPTTSGIYIHGGKKVVIY